MALPGPDARLSTRIGTLPRASRSIDRERLRRLLDEAVEARLVLLSAPAGFGKSTLLASWLGQAEARVAWLSLEPGDQDIVRFARALELTADRLSGRADAPGRRDAAEPFDAELALVNVLDRVVEAVSDGSSREAVLVLDDYHVIGEPAIHGLVSSLIERLPPRARLVIATRADPPLPLARLRGRGELLEIRAADLRFSVDEADEMLRSASIELPPADITTLAERTEGWAAALRLAAVSLRNRRQPPLHP